MIGRNDRNGLKKDETIPIYWGVATLIDSVIPHHGEKGEAQHGTQKIFPTFHFKNRMRGCLCLLADDGCPTGWIYDLGVGTGTEQGQMPDQSVSVVHTQDDVEDFFFQTIPATVPKDSLIRCPCCACGIPSMRGNTPTSTARQRGQLSFLNISP